MKMNFHHQQAAHCENGVTSNLLRYYGIDISEAMAFGLASGLFFIYLPFLKFNGVPVTSYRPLPGLIFTRTAASLGIKVYRRKFRSKEESMQALDRALGSGIPVGLQVGVFHLPYFPRPYRFHFNAHNIVVYGKEDDRYLVSDPVMENPEVMSYAELMRSRWARGIFQPRGQMYYPLKVPSRIDLAGPILKGIRKSCREMLDFPIPLIGIRGIRYLSRQIKRWPERLGGRTAALYLGQVVRMQEEIGTGGAGFRFIYAAFLQEAAEILENHRLEELSQAMTENGDRWRDFAVIAGRIIKNRSSEAESYSQMSEIVSEIADREQQILTELRKAVS